MVERSLPDVVVLAAGRSSRMGFPKGLAIVEGKTWIERQLEAIGAGGMSAIVVLGLDAPRYVESVPRLASRARVVQNPDPDRGPFSSLQCGLAPIAPGESVFVLPIDVPAAHLRVWQALASGLAGGFEAAVPTYEGRGGHPVLLSSSLRERIVCGPVGGRLDQVLGASRVTRVPVADERVRMNLNVPGDWGKVGLGT